MSGGVIVLITAAGSAFGAMLKVAHVGDSIKMMFGGNTQGLAILFLAFGIAALLKIAQGSSTAAMIITSGMMPGMLAGVDLPFDMVYLEILPQLMIPFQKSQILKIY
jgi:H+/gluconate symporter-like permease